jgi:hypothetical protein
MHRAHGMARHCTAAADNLHAAPTHMYSAAIVQRAFVSMLALRVTASTLAAVAIILVGHACAADVSYPATANLTDATIATNATATVADATGPLPDNRADNRRISHIGFSVTNLHTDTLTITTASLVNDSQLAASFTHRTHNGSCGPLPASRSLAAFNMVTPSNVLARISLTLGSIAYEHPGRSLLLCNATDASRGSWVSAASLVPTNSSVAASTTQTSAGSDVVVSVVVARAGPYVLVEDPALDSDARCASTAGDKRYGIRCESTNAMEQGTAYPLIVTSLVLYPLSVLADVVRLRLKYASLVRDVFFMLASVFLYTAVGFYRSRRDPAQWVSIWGERAITAITWILVPTLGLIASQLLLMMQGTNRKLVPDSASSGSSSARGTATRRDVAWWPWSMRLVAWYIGLLVVASPAAPKSGATDVVSPQLEALVVVVVAAFAVLCDTFLQWAMSTAYWIKAREGVPASHTCSAIVRDTNALVLAFAFAWTMFFFLLVPGGNRPNFDTPTLV